MRKIAENIVKGVGMIAMLCILLTAPGVHLGSRAPLILHLLVVSVYVVDATVLIYTVIDLIRKFPMQTLLVVIIIGVLVASGLRVHFWSDISITSEDVTYAPEFSNAQYCKDGSKSYALGPEIIYEKNRQKLKMPAYCWAERVLDQEQVTKEDYFKAMSILNTYGPTDYSPFYKHRMELVN